ncbi:response regulator transcription factor [Bifidobacterium oedipodis]|uniref:Two component transcriptional regulator, LuxR family n=1 Tax=Bifidobacterium oedipodis TaxID=2675322 RepID=A0A7Y0ENG6_9BIFI|nr:response regulator transcription factor [Bifidobacterium sp. DSM 109957]NMM93539.1 two component transcriptional regulator, LuxR family [Bifidobacterium sp. DSM 109957]
MVDRTLVAALDNDHMALVALRGIMPQLLPGSIWLWGVENGEEAVRRALDPQTRPRVLLVDMSLGESTGVNVCRRIRMSTDRVALLAITAFLVTDYCSRVAQAGAQGIVSKADVPALAQALRTVANGGLFVPSGVDDVVFHTAADAHAMLQNRTTVASNSEREPSAKLGSKEAETLHLLSRGLSYDQIAAQWNVATSTVRTHAHRAVEKLGANSLAHAIAIWLSR